MRKATPLLIILMLLFSLPAQKQVPSNSIGQDRGRFVEESDYTLLLEDGSSVLYHQDEALWKESRRQAGDLLEVTTIEYGSGTTHYKRYEGNRLIAEGEGERMRYFYYDERGLMAKSMTLMADKLIETELYTYDVGTKSLSSILTITQKGSSISYFGDPVGEPWFTFAKNDTFTKVTQISQNLQIQDVWLGDTKIKSVQVEMGDDGTLRLTTTSRGRQESELYSAEGLLVLHDTPSLTTEYRYNDDRSLKEIREESPDSQVRIIRYEEGRKVSESIYQGEMLEKETLYPEGKGKIETLYDNGLPYSDITYAADGKRVLSIRYR